MTPLIVDAHQHFWDPDRGDFPWLAGRFEPLRRVFAPEHLAPELSANGVSATVLVQTQWSLAETKQFLETAARTDFVAGIVGWVDLTDPAVGDTIAALKERPDGQYLVGIRHQVHDEPDPDWLSREDVRRGLAEVARHGLVYDLLIRPREIPAALRVVRALPELRFVVDHIAKPDIAHGGFGPWAEAMRDFASEREHVWCKLSGMVTEDEWSAWTPTHLAPYIGEALDIFGPDRCLFGSDWPVCLAAASYTEVLEALRINIAHLAEEDQAQILARSAVDVYGLALTA